MMMIMVMSKLRDAPNAYLIFCAPAAASRVIFRLHEIPRRRRPRFGISDDGAGADGR